MWINSPPSNYKVLTFPNGDKAFIDVSAKLGNLSIGRYSYINANTTLNGRYPITIGAFCSISFNVYCWTYESHQITFPTTFPLRTVLGLDIDYSECIEKPNGVKIGNDVWIAEGVRIMPGVTIGDGCVVGARAVVTKDLQPYGVYAGVPARQIKKRFSEKVIEELLEIKWWNWSLEKIQRNVSFFNIDLNNFSGSLNDYIVD